MIDFHLLRINMIKGQLLPNGITDKRLVDAFYNVKREMFLPVASVSLAYTDCDVSLDDNRHLLAPRTLARLLQMASITSKDHVLIVGSGYGYSCALVSHLAQTVTGIDSHETVIHQAKECLEDYMASPEIYLQCVEDPLQGLEEKGPYTCIIIEHPALQGDMLPLRQQLTLGGRIVGFLPPAGPHLPATACIYYKDDEVEPPSKGFQAFLPSSYQPDKKEGFSFDA